MWESWGSYITTKYFIYHNMYSSGVWQVFHFFYQWCCRSPCDERLRLSWKEGARPLPSLPFFIPSVSTNRRNLGKVSVILCIEERFDLQRFCGNLSELAQLCGSILIDLLASCLVLFSEDHCPMPPILCSSWEHLWGAAEAVRRCPLAVPFLSVRSDKKALDLIYLIGTSGFCLL